MMEARRWLATGHARTANARNRSRAAWEEIAVALNSGGSGCIKSWQQWCKYWKDKKGAVKRKASELARQRRQTGGGPVEDIASLNNIEQRIEALMGGESFATGDINLTIDPFPASEPPSAGQNTGSNTQSQSILLHVPVNQPSQGIEQQSAMQEIQMCGNELAMPVLGEGSEERIQGGRHGGHDPPQDTPQSPSPINENDEVLPPTDTGTQETEYISPPVQRRPQRIGRRRVLFRSPGSAGGSAARRRLLQRSPPSQRRSEMASLTERFIAIEERRAEAELITARSHENYAQSQQAMAASVTQLAQALNRLAENLIRRDQQ